MRPILASLLCFLPVVAAPGQENPGRTVHVFVALCDNASQGIQPVPAKIGNGDDPPQNLYWGCDDGLPQVFRRAKGWKAVPADIPKDLAGVVLARAAFRHAGTGAVLVADAYRGAEIKRCITDYLKAAAGTLASTCIVEGTPVPIGGRASLVAYIGHNGLMEFDVTAEPPVHSTRVPRRTAVTLCCLSRRYFGPRLLAAGVDPILLTTQLMYPGAFVLREVVDGWLIGESKESILRRAAKAMALNQKISVKSAAGIFTIDPAEPPP